MSRENFKLTTGAVKTFSSHQDQLNILEERGLIINNRQNALDILQRTCYYRFSAYSLSLRKNDCFDEGVTFDNIYELYRFDDAFRKVVLDYSSYIEVAFRSYISYIHTKNHGPLGYLDCNNFWKTHYHKKFIEVLTEEVCRSDDVFVDHHYSQKGSVFPFWVALECSSFGDLSKLFKNLLKKDKRGIVAEWLPNSWTYIESWLQSTVYARNIAAHGGRFYNRKLKSVSVLIPNKYNGIIDNESPFAYIYAINKLVPTQALADGLIISLSHLFSKYPFALKEKMGFPEDWEDILKAEAHKFTFQYTGN